MSTRKISQADLNACGRRLARARVARNLSRMQVAIRIGCSDRAVAAWENGERVPAADWLEALARLYGLTMDQLWTGKDHPDESQATADRIV